MYLNKLKIVIPYGILGYPLPVYGSLNVFPMSWYKILKRRDSFLFHFRHIRQYPFPPSPATPDDFATQGGVKVWWVVNQKDMSNPPNSAFQSSTSLNKIGTTLMSYKHLCMNLGIILRAGQKLYEENCEYSNIREQSIS